MNDAKALRIIGQLVREHRLQRGDSQQDFAVRIGLRAQTIRFFEKGHRWPGEDVRRKIEEGLDWQPGTIAYFRDRALAAADPEAATNTLHRIVPPPPENPHPVPGGGTPPAKPS